MRQLVAFQRRPVSRLRYTQLGMWEPQKHDLFIPVSECRQDIARDRGGEARTCRTCVVVRHVYKS